MSVRDREDREERVVSAKHRVETHVGGGFERTAVRVPEGVKIFKIEKEGSYAVEIIPFDAKASNPHCAPGDYYFERTYYTHAIPDPLSNGTKAYCCPRLNFKKRCPVCDHVSALRENPNHDKNLVKNLAPKERQLWLVYDLDNPTAGLQLWDVSFHLFGVNLDKKIKLARPSDRKIYEEFASPNIKIGSTVKFTASEKKLPQGKPFKEYINIEFAVRREPIPKEVVNHNICLDDLLIEIDYDKLQDILFGRGGEEEGQGRGEEPASGAESRTREDRSVAREPVREDPRREPVRDDRRVEEPRREETRREEPRRDDPPQNRDSTPPREERREREVPPQSPQPAPAATTGKPKTAADLDLRIDDNVSHATLGTCRIVHISQDGDALRLEDSKGNVHRGILVEEVKFLSAGKGAMQPTAAPVPTPPPPPVRQEDRPLPRRDEEPARRRVDDDDDAPPRRR